MERLMDSCLQRARCEEVHAFVRHVDPQWYAALTATYDVTACVRNATRMERFVLWLRRRAARIRPR